MTRLKEQEKSSEWVLGTNFFYFTILLTISLIYTYHYKSHKIDKFLSKPVYQIKVIFTLKNINTCHRYRPTDFSLFYM